MSSDSVDSCDVLVVGGGVAGMSAACKLAEWGLRVQIVEQAPTLGGAVLRRAQKGQNSKLNGVHEPIWRDLMARFDRVRKLISVSICSTYTGTDSTGEIVITNTSTSTSVRLRPKAIIVATGASERVRPRLGWHLPGVMTAGALQVILKTSLRAPKKRVLLAGSGPLLLAVAAQLTRLGNPPLAVIEEARPFRKFWRALSLPAGYLLEAANYMMILKVAGVPILQGRFISRIEQYAGGLRVSITGKDQLCFETDFLALHDGIAKNSYGMRPGGMPIWYEAGDCALGLGARASRAHGEAVAIEVIKQLRVCPVESVEMKVRTKVLLDVLSREMAAQSTLAEIYSVDEQSVLDELPHEVIICRCENKSLSDLYDLGSDPTNREIRLNGRFAMGACQGRFCAHWINMLRKKAGTAEGDRLIGSHWPIKPISIQALMHESDHALSTERECSD